MSLEFEAITLKLINVLNDSGILLYGITSANQKESMFSKKTPNSILENAKSVFCFAQPIPKGILYAKSSSLPLFWRFSNMAYRKMDNIANELCLIIERSGFSATPIYCCYPWSIIDRDFWGVLPLGFWAEKAGIGQLTKCGLLANPTYGTRILLGGLITTAELEPSPQIKEAICPEDCSNCVDVCPPKAISKDGKVDHNKCLRYSGENPLLELVLKTSTIKEKHSFELLLNTIGVDDHGMYTCNECMKACPLNQK